MKRIFSLALLILTSTALFAQATKAELFSEPEKMGSNYYPYHCLQYTATPAPEGYQPFFISHFGRHGSRYIIGSGAFTRTIKALHQADSLGTLTRQGKKLLKELNYAFDAWQGNDGELSALGAREHQGIGHRMVEHYPEVFAGNARVEARATSVHRCQVSMENCTGAIKEDVPSINLHAVYNPEDKYYVSNDEGSPISVEGSKEITRRGYAVCDSLERTVDISGKFFKDRRALENVFGDKPTKFSKDLYHIMRDMQCLPELKLADKMRKLFSNEELYRFYCADNIDWICDEGYFKGTDPRYYGHYRTVKHMFDAAQNAIDNGTNGADMIFSHDSYLIRLARAFEFDQAHEIPADFVNISDYFSTYKVISMAGNIQLIFYRKAGSDDILVKFLLMEADAHVPVKTDIWPYYHWNDVKAYYMPKIDAAISTLSE